jgi:outer membrane lipoprotein-sorting protein
MTHKDPHDELLDRSLAAMRDAPIPDGPPPGVFADTLSALRRAESESQPQLRPQTRFQRILTMKSLSRLAASVVVATGVALALVTLRPSGVAFGQIVDKLARAKALSFKSSTTVPIEGKPEPLTVHLTYLMTDDGRARIESHDTVSIMNSRTGEHLTLNPTHKTATRIKVKKELPPGTDPLDELKKLRNQDAKDLGEKEIGGRKAKGFSSTSGSAEYVVWADKQTGAPIRIDWTVPSFGGKTTTVMTDFDVNPTIDDAMFDTTIPAGYHVADVPDEVVKQIAGANGEQHVIAALRGFAERSNGRFPKRLDDWFAFASLVDGKDGGKPNQEDVAFMSHVGAIASWAFQLSAYEYTGENVTLGEKDKLVFWYQDAKTKQHRAIYGDLTARDVTPDQLPKKK